MVKIWTVKKGTKFTKSHILIDSKNCKFICTNILFRVSMRDSEIYRDDFVLPQD